MQQFSQQQELQPWALVVQAEACTLPPWTAQDALPVLLTALQHDSEVVRYTAACSLWFWAHRDPEQVKTHCAALEKTQQEEKDNCTKAQLQAVVNFLSTGIA